MALNPSAAYTGQIDTTDPTGYPYGRAKNVAAIGDGTGTPLEEKWVSDLFGGQQALLVEAGITPSGAPDKVGASQYLDAFKAVARRETQKAQAQNWPERASVASAASNNSDTPIAWAPLLVGVSLGPIFCVMPQNQFPVTSEDGALWTARAGLGGIMTGSAKDIAFGSPGGTYQLLSSDSSTGTLVKSLDGGVTWTQVGTTSIPTSSVMAWSGPLGLWVAAGNSGAIKTSFDGATWTTRSTPAGWIAGCGGAKRIVWNGSRFTVLPLGVYNKILTSLDGITWAEWPLSVNGTWVGLAYGTYDGIWMAVTVNGVVNKSADGLTWVAVPTTSLVAANDIAVNNYSLWVAATAGGFGGGLAWSVDQGLTWRNLAVGNHRVATAGWQRVIFADGRFVVAHANGSSLEFALSQRALP